MADDDVEASLYSARVITARILSGDTRVRHGFFTRNGGISVGVYASLNCGLGSGDDLDHVRANRERALRKLDLPPDRLATAYQVHSAEVRTVDRPWSAAERPRVDGLATRMPRLALGILTADCLPILFADVEEGVIGAAHAGWRGALAGIAEATVASMVGLGARAERIVAALGPCIRQPSYEVGAEFRDTFVAADHASRDLFLPSRRPNHYQFDLPGFVERRLQAIPIAAIEVLPYDTLAEFDRFFSYRRTTLNGGGDYGRMLSAIAVAA